MTPEGNVPLELDDIQSGVLRPRPTPYAATYIVLRIEDRNAGRELMRRVSTIVLEEQLHTQLEVAAFTDVEIAAAEPPSLEASPPWETVAEMFRDPVSPEVADAYQFVFDSPLLQAAPPLADYARESFAPATPLLAG